MQQLMVWAAFCLLVLVLCLLRPNAGRIFLGIFFLLMAIGLNVVRVFVDPDSYIGLGADSYIPLYRWVFTDFLALAPPLFVLPVAAFEITIELLIREFLAVKNSAPGMKRGALILACPSMLGAWPLTGGVPT